MKIKFFFDFTMPWHDAEMCVLGIWTLREKGQWFQVGLSFLFIGLGIHFGEDIGK